MKLALVSVVVSAALVVGAAFGGETWQSEPPLPVARTEVAATVAGGWILVAGGYLADGSTTGRVDLFDPARGVWKRGPDLPEPRNHASAATLAGKAVVVGGYGASGPSRTAFVLEGRTWRQLPPLPWPRAAGGAVVLGQRLYVVGGVAGQGLARGLLAYDPARLRWSQLPGPTPRQHLAAVVADGRIYAIGGRTFGADTNVATVESWAPGETGWRSEPDLPEAWGGDGASVARGLIVSVGGEAPQGTRASVHGFDPRTRRWRRLADLPTPRHGLGVVSVAGQVYAIAGGPEPGLSVSSANEVLRGR